MASGFEVTPDRLWKISAQMSTGAADVDAILSGLSGDIAPVRSEWVGVAPAQFDVLWNQLQREARGLRSGLTGIAKLTQKAAAAYEAAEESIVQSFNEFRVEQGVVDALIDDFDRTFAGGGFDQADTEVAPQPAAADQLMEQLEGEMLEGGATENETVESDTDEISEWFDEMTAVLPEVAFDSEAVEVPVVAEIEADHSEEVAQSEDHSEEVDQAEDHSGLVAQPAVVAQPEEVLLSVDRPKAGARLPWARFMTKKAQESVAVETHVTVETHGPTDIEEIIVEEVEPEVPRTPFGSGWIREEALQGQGIRLEEPRPLSEAEKGILETLLTAEFPGVEELRAQVAEAWVVAECPCGCPTVDLWVAPDVPASSVTTHNHLAPVKGWVTPVADERHGKILLCVGDGRMTGLEYVSYDNPAPSEWPSLDRLAVERTDNPLSASSPGA